MFSKRVQAEASAMHQLIERIELTRSRIESHLVGPAVVSVSAARADDGASALAMVLAHSFSRAGHATLLVEGRFAMNLENVAPSKLDRDVFSKIGRGRKGLPDLLNVDALPVRSLAEIREMYAAVRSQYAITIAAHSLQENPGMMGLASLSDMVLISFRKGRAACDEDRDLSELLRSSGKPVLGVVLVQADAIKAVSTMPAEPMALSFTESETALKRTTLSARVG